MKIGELLNIISLRANELGLTKDHEIIFLIEDGGELLLDGTHRAHNEPQLVFNLIWKDV